jgi:hypothetical protein
MSRSSYLRKVDFTMIRKFSFALCLMTVACQLAMGQTASGNILTGNVKADVINRYSGPAVLPKPDKVLIRDFAVPVGAITTDGSIAGQLHRRIMLRHGVDEDSSPKALAKQLQAAFTKALTSELRTTNIPAQKMPATEGDMSGSNLIVEGQFVAIHEGDETKRILIGFGRGASDIKTHVTVSTLVQGHSTVVLEFNLSSESGKKPGAAATMGVGSLAVGAATGGVSDRKSTVEADASRMGKLVAKQLETFMADQKWISNSPGSTSTGQHE